MNDQQLVMKRLLSWKGTQKALSDATGISIRTLWNLKNVKGYNPSVAKINTLRSYFAKSDDHGRKLAK